MSIAICSLNERYDLKAFPQLELNKLTHELCFVRAFFPPPLFSFSVSLQQFSPLVEASPIEVGEKNRSMISEFLQHVSACCT